MKILIIFLSIGLSLPAFAGDINWSGKYQVEANLIKNPSLGTDDEYSYLNHHLVLNPHIVAADGITIHTRFDIFNNGYNNSQFGEFFGGSSVADENKAITGETDNEDIVVSELYMSWVHQFGSLLAGRAPVHFGLGLVHNAGNGEFDHWFDRKDLVGYKFVFGNIYIMPMYGKVREGSPDQDDDIRDYMVQFTYENLDTDLEISLFYQQRKANPGGNDLSTTTNIFNVAATKDGTSKFAVDTMNLFVKKKYGAFSYAIEAAMQDGDTGLITGGKKIEIDAYAIAAEFAYKPQGSKWDFDLKIGTVSGDDPGTPATYEGFLVDRNYNLGILLFNYMLGDGATSIIGNENYINAITANPPRPKVDVGQMSNVLYFAPGFNWKWNEKWSMNGRFIYAQLSEAQIAGQSKDLGIELDFGIYHRPFERFVLGLDVGYLVTGDAFKGAGNLTNDDAYAIITKAAITF